MNTLLNISEANRGIGVLESTRNVVERARHVWIDERAIEKLCTRLIQDDLKVPAWSERYHWSDGTLNTATALLLLDAWNFCFWPDQGKAKWSVTYQGETVNGYKALAASVKRAIESGMPLYDADFLVCLKRKDLKEIFRGKGTIPMMKERLANAHEIGQGLRERWQGKFENLLLASENSAVSFTELLVETFPSFNDTSLYFGHEVKFYKRAQILAVDLKACMPDEPLVQFHDVSDLSAFADYKIPQVLEANGVLRYSPELKTQLSRYEGLPKGDPQEVEIRAGMIWAVEIVRREMSEQGRELSAFELDWMLWNLGQEPQPDEGPYHRTRTIFY